MAPIIAPPTLILSTLLACSGGGDDSGAVDTGGDDPAGVEVLSLDTRDGVTLQADLYAGAGGAPAVLLLHMNPSGGWSRVDWPGDFLQRLVDQGFWVLALDRRGAGASGGVAEDAYQGEKGRYDVEAAAILLDGRGAGDLLVVAASNGTTSMVDYAVWAGGEGLPEPVGLGFLTGGSYTENQTAMEDLPAVPAFFTYSTAERAWSVDQEPLDPGSWSFREYEDGAHGTHMFEAVDDFGADIEAELLAITGG
ncbi:MAG: hypothetical protein H6742_00395 [Alphaproteobacteria bacterium]|nr:hypothetical protein [Alphaproteobacteria bacterium]